MSPQTIEEIRKIEARLAKEISERQALIEAYRTVREDLSRHGNSNGANQHDGGVDLLLVPHHPTGAAEKGYGENTRLVRQAISKMPIDYNIRDIYNYLRGHGYQIGVNPIATVLMRLKKKGEIQEAQAGRGRRPAVFKKV
jgi:uncharacterized protein (UPF0335 family)